MASLMPSALDKGNQKTENPYAMPMHKWMAKAAGGTSQRLKPSPAMMRSLERKPGVPEASVVELMVSPFFGLGNLSTCDFNVCFPST